MSSEESWRDRPNHIPALNEEGVDPNAKAYLATLEAIIKNIAEVSNEPKIAIPSTLDSFLKIIEG